MNLSHPFWKNLPETLPKDPFATSFEDTLSETLRSTLPEDPLRNRLRKPLQNQTPPEDPFDSQPATSLAETLSRTTFGTCHIGAPPFEALRSAPHVPKLLRSRPEALPNALRMPPSKPSPEPPSEPFGEGHVSRKPGESSSEPPPFGTLRSMTLVPQPSPK